MPIQGGSTRPLHLPGCRAPPPDVPRHPITADADVQLTLGDGSLIALPKGAKIRLDGCSQASPRSNWKVELGLILGKIWSKTPAKNTRDLRVRTERVVAAVRGTIFWLAYAHGVSTLHVDRDSVSLSPTTRRWGRWKTAIVRVGHTATQHGTKAPVVHTAPIDLNPPF